MPGERWAELHPAGLRDGSRIPILLLTAMAEPSNRIAGLERGADDYVVKPFEPRELVLRIRNILQRVPRIPMAEPATELRLGAYRLDPRRGELFRGVEPVRLTAAETAPAGRAGARHAGRRLVAPRRCRSSRRADLPVRCAAIDVQMTCSCGARSKAIPNFPRYLQTVRGVGYVLKPD